MVCRNRTARSRKILRAINGRNPAAGISSRDDLAENQVSTVDIVINGIQHNILGYELYIHKNQI